MKTCNSAAMRLIVGLAVLVGLPAVSSAQERCGAQMLHGKYVFTSTGFTRPAASGPGTPWVPKAILEVMTFNGDGSLTTPVITLANAFGDTGTLLAPPAGGAPGAYIVNEDCSGRIHFFDATAVMYNIYIEASGDSIFMIQTNPINNVSLGTARRVR